MKTVPTLQEITDLYPNTEAIFFDMDGTLFNTEPIHGEAIKSIIDLKKKDGMSVHEINEEFTGYLDHMVYTTLLERELIPTGFTWSDFLATKNEIMLKMIDKLPDDEAFPQESRQLIEDISNSNIKLGLVTSSERVITDAMLDHFGIDNKFDLTTTRDDVNQYKPDPLPYLKSMKMLNVDGDHSVVLEDSTAGLKAAHASGAHGVIEAGWFH